MKDSEKNRDPERASARAVSDARCALRKLGLLAELAAAVALLRGAEDHELADAYDQAAQFVENIASALAVTEGDR